MEEEENPKLTEDEVIEFCVSLIKDCIIQAAQENYLVWLTEDGAIKVMFSIQNKWAKAILDALHEEVPLPDDVVKTVEKMTGHPISKKLK